MSTYPKQLRLFKAWAKAMEEGATVGNPSYRGSKTASTATSGRATGRKRFRRKRKRRAHAKKTQD